MSSEEPIQLEDDIGNSKLELDVAAPEVSTRSHEGLSALQYLSTSRKIAILVVLCSAFFLETVNNSSLFSATPPISLEVGLSNSQSVWLLAAYQLTFAAFLLISGRISDLYNPKWAFVCGTGSMAIFGLIAGFIRSKIPLIVLRALLGAGGALTVPSAQRVIVHMFPDPVAQAKAIGVFGGMGAIGIVMGLVIGALLVTFASWPWVFYFTAIVSGLITVLIIFLIPNISRASESGESKADKILRFKRLDIAGVGLFALSLILFIFAVTSGSIDGWGSAKVIAPLVISVVLMLVFFIWEASLPESYAALPPKIWRYDNVLILVIIALVPFMWWGSIFTLFSWLWEVVYGYSALETAVHFLPIALGIFPSLPLSVFLQSKIQLKLVILLGFFLLISGCILLPFGNSRENYWPFLFPGFLLGTAGATVIYATTNIAILARTPSEASGIVSALFVAFLQTGGATGLSIVTSIQTSVQVNHGGPTNFQGRAAGLWFLVGINGFMMIIFLIFMKNAPLKSQLPLVEEEKTAIS